MRWRSLRRVGATGQRRRLGRIALAAGGLLVGAGLAEVLARVGAPVPGEELLFGAPEAVPAALYTSDPVLRMVPTPGFSSEIAGLGYRVPLRINSHGVRGAEPGAGPRWIAVGDSFTLAIQVPEELSFAGRLATRLGVEVTNAGVDGYSTWQATRRYLAAEESYGADGVLLTFFLGNDVLDNERFILPGGPGGAPPGAPMGTSAGMPPGMPPGAPPGTPPGTPPGKPARAPRALSSDPVTRFLFRNSVAFAWTRVALRRWSTTDADTAEMGRFREELAIFDRTGAARLAAALPRTRAALVELRDAVRAHGDRLVVAVAPPAFAVDPERAASTLATFGLTDPAVDAPRAAVLDLLGTLGVAACDLQPALTTAAAGGESVYLRYDGHWSAAGHAVVAEVMAGCVGRAGR